MSEATQNRAPAADTGTPVEKVEAAPARCQAAGYAAGDRLAARAGGRGLLEVRSRRFHGAVGGTRTSADRQEQSRDPAVDQAEQAAAQTLRERKILVIEEPHTPAASEEAHKPAAPEEAHKPAAPKDKRVTSVNFCGTSVFGDKPVERRAACRFVPLHRSPVVERRRLQSHRQPVEVLGRTDENGFPGPQQHVGQRPGAGEPRPARGDEVAEPPRHGDFRRRTGLHQQAAHTVWDAAVYRAAGGLGHPRVLANLCGRAGIAKLLFFVLTLLTVLSLPAGGVPRAPLRNLKVLDLSKTKITDAGIKKLLPLQNLKWLLLAETSISDAGLEQLAPLTELGRLTLNKTKVTAAGMAKLEKVDPQAGNRL